MTVGQCLSSPVSRPPERGSPSGTMWCACLPRCRILEVNTTDPAMLNLPLNNAANVGQYYSALGEPVEIEIITFGPGLHMLRADTSPVKDRIKSMAESRPSVTFKACGNTQENMGKAENKKIPLVSQATVVKSGVVR